MPYNEELYRKFYGLIDVASGGCRVRNTIIKKWRERGDLDSIIDEVIAANYNAINIPLLKEIKDSYENNLT